MTPVDPHTPPDYLFAGAGASAILVMMALERRGLLSNKRVLLIDPDPKTANDKTFCFWALPEEPVVAHCRNLIRREWSRMSVNGQTPESLVAERYYHVSSQDLYAELHRMIHTYGCRLLSARVEDMMEIDGITHVVTDSGTFTASVVFDSRPPRYLPLAPNQAHLAQSFVGYVVRTESPLSDTESMDLMDFNVDQQGWTQFVYTLPFDSHSALVELTRFGQDILTAEEAAPVLTDYIKHRLGRYTIQDVEKGVIPMSSATIHHQPLPGVMPIGSRAGLVKPSTGYAFKNMVLHGEAVAEGLKRDRPLPPPARTGRYALYDRLLLYILARNPALGKPIFLALFRHNRIPSVLRFLNEKTTLWQDFRIFSTLPIRPFLRALGVDTYYRIHNALIPALLLMLSIMLWVLQSVSPAAYAWAEPLLLILGLLAWGIPHGAVDHLLEGQALNRFPGPRFFLWYIGWGGSFFLLWLYSPGWALLGFLAYSVWHFGEGDMTEWRLRQIHFVYPILWGSLLLGTILLGHLDETNQIVGQMGVSPLPLRDAQGRTLSWLLLSVGVLWGLIHRRLPMVLCGLMLAVGLQLPLLTAFGLYFIGQHSIISWSHLKQQLHTSGAALYRKALPFTVGALLLLGLMMGITQKTDATEETLPFIIKTFFIFISCISLPHVLVMRGFYERMKSVQ